MPKEARLQEKEKGRQGITNGYEDSLSDSTEKPIKKEKVRWAVGEVELGRVRLQCTVWQWLLGIMGKRATTCWKGGGVLFESLSGRPYYT